MRIHQVSENLTVTPVVKKISKIYESQTDSCHEMTSNDNRLSTLASKRYPKTFLSTDQKGYKIINNFKIDTINYIELQFSIVIGMAVDICFAIAQLLWMVCQDLYYSHWITVLIWIPISENDIQKSLLAKKRI